MSLRELANSDLVKILGDASNGFGWSIAFTSPDGIVTQVIGFSNDIAQVIDVNTGQIVSGRLASVAVQMSSLPTLPVGVSSPTSKPWLVQFLDIGGGSHTFKVIKSHPDRGLGLVTCILEAYA